MKRVTGEDSLKFRRRAGKGIQKITLTIFCLLLCFLYEAAEPPLVKAEWSGKGPGALGTPEWSALYGSPGAACGSWADHRQGALIGMTPMMPSAGPFVGRITLYVCTIRNLQGGLPLIFPDSTGLVCDPPEVWNPMAAKGCAIRTPPPPKEKEKPCDPKIRCCENKGKPPAGNPISLATGHKYEEVVDFSTAGSDALSFVRFYNSESDRTFSSFGLGWRSNYDRQLHFESSTKTHTFRPDGHELTFTLTNGVWTADADVSERLSTNGTTWTFTDENDTQEVYDNTGKLLTITTRNGYQQTLAYDANGHLSTVTDSFSRQISLSFELDKLKTVTAADGTIYTYRYDRTISELEKPDRLVGITYPDNTPLDPTDNPTLTYLYENSDFPWALTGTVDHHGTRLSTYGYDAYGQTILSEHANGAGRVEVAYNSELVRTVMLASGQQLVYNFAWIQGTRKVTQVDRVATATVPAASEYYTYDASGFLASHTDWKGTLTTYVRNSHGMETSRTEASGTPQARSITTTWHGTWHVPTSIVEPGKTTTFTYTGQGQVQTRTETDTTGGPTNGETRTWTYTYTGNGQVATVNGPRTDVSDVTTYTYTTEGYLKTTTNAVSQVTEVLSHTSRGLPAVIKDPNGVETHLAYHPRGWLHSTTRKSAQGDATTRFTYDDYGQVVRITRPDGAELRYEYDAAQRVVAVSNLQNERIEYTVNAAGKRLSETVKSGTGSVKRTQSRTFDSLNRLLTQVGGASQTTAYTYDANSNRLTLTDPLSHQTQQAFDPLNRLITVTDAATNTATYGYNAQDQLMTVADQRSLTTTYTYNAFGDVIQQTSPDTGTSTYQTDQAGNRTQETDARSVVTTYTYDALNRVLTRQFAGASSENIAYTYDATAGGNKGKGRLTGFTDHSGSTALVYDDRGNVVTETRIINSHTAILHYTYDLADQLVRITYPSGRLVTYHRDAQGRVDTVTTQAAGGSAPSLVASNITYQPFGPMASLTYGNGLILNLTYDQDYRLTALQTAAGGTTIQNLSYTYNAADNITTLTDLLTSARTQTLGYDVLNRLTSATGVYGTLGFTLDGVGNRLTRTQGGSTETYTYDTVSNRLLSTTQGSQTRSFTYLPNGQITTDTRSGPDVYSLTYAAQNRLTQVTQNGQPIYQYFYNALGQRVIKDALVSGPDTHAVYDREGRLLVETDTQGAAIKEYVYVDGLPVAVLDAGVGGGGPALDLILDNGQPGVTTVGTWSTSTAGSGYEGTNYLTHQLTGTVVDNPAATFTGAWTTTSVGTGYQGTNYRTRNATAPTPVTVIVDNRDVGFSLVDTWEDWAGSTQYSFDYRYHAQEGLPTTATILDNTGANFAATGPWTTATTPTGYEGTNYHKLDKGQLPAATVVYEETSPIASWTGTWTDQPWNGHRLHAQSSSTTDAFTWTLPITETKVYHIYARWHGYWARPTNATYTLHHSSGSTQVVVDQKVNGAPTWNYLGSVTMAPGQNHRVELSGQSNGYPSADAIAVVPGDAQGNLATWQPVISVAQDYGLYARWPKNNLANPAAVYRLFHGDGTTDFTVDQTVAGPGSTWIVLGLFPLAPNEDHRVEVEGSITYMTEADAIAVSAAPIAATWTPDLPVTDTYHVYAWWPADPSHHAQATYHVYHAGGISRVTVNQQQNGGQWNLLGTYALAPGSNHRVTVTPQFGGKVVADAIKFEATGSSTPRTASWALPVSATNTYDVYARWVADPANATNATYTVFYSGGTTPVSMNQTQNGEKWNLLGTFTLDPSLNPKVELSDQANGTVVADAVMVVPSGTSADRVTYTPTLGGAGTLDIYAKWSESHTRAETVTYTIHHGSGSTDIMVNQQQPSAGWFRLGAFTMSPGQNHRVEVEGAFEGETVADAMRFVSAGTSAPGIHYVHADHLGSPQKMTDANQALVWDAVYTPFGQVHSITGTATNNQRFPGQYADAETGFNYNYFRDYDPTTGRYIQSDPIGLDGGDESLYRYVFHNPLNSTDPSGLFLQFLLPLAPVALPAFEIGAAAVFDFAVGFGLGTAVLNAAQNALTSADTSSSLVPNIFQSQGKGERGLTGTESGTDNPFKHMKPHPTDPTKVLVKDPRTGKLKTKAKPQGFDEAWKKKHSKKGKEQCK